MPLFMFVSGYVFDLNNKYKWNFIELREVMWKKMLTLLLPGFVLGLFVSYILGKVICFPWFLRALFEISITFFCLKILFRKVDKIYVDFVILIVGYCLLFLFGRLCKGSALDTFLGIPYWQIFYPYFVIGFLFRKYNMYKLIAKYRLYSVSLILFIAFFYFGYISVGVNYSCELSYPNEEGIPNGLIELLARIIATIVFSIVYLLRLKLTEENYSLKQTLILSSTSPTIPPNVNTSINITSFQSENLSSSPQKAMNQPLNIIQKTQKSDLDSNQYIKLPNNQNNLSFFLNHYLVINIL